MSGSGTAIHGFFKEFLVLRQQSWDLSPGVFIVVVTVASLHHFSQHHKGLSQIHDNIFPPRGTLLNTERYFLFVPSYVFFFQQRLSERHWRCIIVALFSYFSQAVGRGTSFLKYHCVGLFIFLLDPVQIIVWPCPSVRFSLTKRWKGQRVYLMSVLRFYHLLTFILKLLLVHCVLLFVLHFSVFFSAKKAEDIARQPGLPERRQGQATVPRTLPPNIWYALISFWCIGGKYEHEYIVMEMITGVMHF